MVGVWGVSGVYPMWILKSPVFAGLWSLLRWAGGATRVNWNPQPIRPRLWGGGWWLVVARRE